MKNLLLLRSEKLLLTAIVLKGLAYPGWQTCVELGFVLAYGAYRWRYEPKEVAKEELSDKVQQEVAAVKTELGILKTFIGFDPKARFSMFNHKRG